MKAIQQGDVRLRRKEIPKDAKPCTRTERGWVLAEGEVTGHAHVITSDQAQMYDHNGTLYLRIGVPTTIEHEEHKPITLEPGEYEIWRVREKDMLEGYVRTVKD